MSGTNDFIGPKDSPIWAERFFARFFGPRNIHPLWVVPLITFVIVLPMFIAYWIAGVFDGVTGADDIWGRYLGFWFEIFMSALTGFFVAAAEMIRRGYRADLSAMAGIVTDGDETIRALRQDYDRQMVRRRTLIGVLTGIILAAVFGSSIDVSGFHRVITDIVYLRLLLAGYVSAVFIYDGVQSCRRMGRIARDRLIVDLLDIARLEPSTRTGLRVGSMAFVGSALSVPLLAEESVVVMTMIMQLVSLIGAALLLLQPVMAVHHAIQRAKDKAVIKANRAIRDARKADKAGKSGSSGGAGALADAIAWRRFLDDVPEWPTSAMVYWRFTGFAVLPLLSLGSALAVEILAEVLTK